MNPATELLVQFPVFSQDSHGDERFTDNLSLFSVERLEENLEVKIGSPADFLPALSIMGVVKLVDSQQEGAATSRGNEFDYVPGHDLVANTNDDPTFVRVDNDSGKFVPSEGFFTFEIMGMMGEPPVMKADCVSPVWNGVEFFQIFFR
jgi:hypothetical protein